MQQANSRNVITAEEALAILLGLVDLESLEQIEYVNSCGLGSIVDALARDNKKMRDQFNACVAALSDELKKGQRSVLKLDYALSNKTDIYITLDSFRAWATGRLLPAKLPGGAPSTVSGLSPAPSGHATKPKRIKLRDQEDAILDEIRRKHQDPMALPKNPAGKDGIKAAVRAALRESPLFKGPTTFDKAWERLARDGRMVLKPDPPPHK
jgi:hypothetical protein